MPARGPPGPPGLACRLDVGGARHLPAGPQPGHHTVNIGVGPVLAEFVLRLNPGDEKLDADDRAQLAGNVALGGIVDRPGPLGAGFVVIAQPPDMAGEPGRIVMDDEVAVDVGRGVVPGGNDASVLCLGRVPRR